MEKRVTRSMSIKKLTVARLSSGKRKTRSITNESAKIIDNVNHEKFLKYPVNIPPPTTNTSKSSVGIQIKVQNTLKSMQVENEVLIEKRITRAMSKIVSFTEVPDGDCERSKDSPQFTRDTQKSSKLTKLQKRESSNKQICVMNSFRIGDIVFVHLKGYSNWPSKVIGIVEGKRKRYTVEFFEHRSRMAIVFQSQITDFLSGLRSASIKSKIHENAELNRFTKEAMVHVFGRIVSI